MTPTPEPTRCGSCGKFTAGPLTFMGDGDERGPYAESGWVGPCCAPTPAQVAEKACASVSALRLAWHDVTCPEGDECRDRNLHALGYPEMVATVWRCLEKLGIEVHDA